MTLFAFMDEIKGIFYKNFETSFVPHILKELYVDKLFSKYLYGKKDLVCIDAGANVGLFTHYLYPFSKKIYAIEPSSDHLEVLNTMLKFNKMEDKVVVIPKALYVESGDKIFYKPKENSTMYTLVNEPSFGVQDTETVPCTTIDEVFEQNKIEHLDVFKLDVEGVELEILGSKGFDKVCEKIDLIVGEFHTWGNYNPNLLITTLKDRGFKAYFPNRTEIAIFIAEKIK